MNSKYRTMIIVIIILLALCCLGSLAAFVGTAAFNSSRFVESPRTAIPPARLNLTPGGSPFNFFNTKPRKTATGLGISQADMIRFYSEPGFNFDKPGDGAVRGIRKYGCVKDNCPTVTLLGPADNLDSITLVVPVDARDKDQAVLAVSILSGTLMYFSGDDPTFSLQIVQDLPKAQSDGQPLDKTAKVNGYAFSVNYIPANNVATLVVSKKE